MMQASNFEYHFRFPLHVLIFALGLFAPWLSFGDVLNLETRSVWLVLASWLFRTGLLSFTGATMVLLGLALLLTGISAVLRVWGAAYAGDTLVGVHDTGHLLVDGPFRYARNPLYLGTIVHTLGVALLMPPSGALLAVAALWLLNFRLALREEHVLRARFGQAYEAYAARVPRFLPAPSAQLASSPERPHWLRALLGEIYFVSAFAVLAAFGWDFNASPLRRSLIFCLGASLVVRAFLPRPRREPAAHTAA